MLENKTSGCMAIASVPMQKYEEPMDFEEALYTGTIFKNMDFPFYKADRLEKRARAGVMPGSPAPDSNRVRLFQEINEASFALIDIQLYLDTHPDDREALEFFQTCLKKRKYATEEFESKYYPLKLECVFHNPAGEQRWSWADGPAPWEGGCC